MLVMILRTLLIWFGLLVLAILNGGFRETFLVPQFGRSISQAVSTIMLSALIFVAGWTAVPWIGPRSPQHAWTIGILWVMLTLAFEFLAGHFLFGKPWQELFADYDIRAGRIWIMVLIVTLVTPIVVFKNRGL